MSAISAVNPRPFLLDLIDKPVTIRLKWGSEYHGLLMAIDSYMNVQLSNAEEYIEGKNAGPLGNIVIRCNNILFVKSGTEAVQNGTSMDTFASANNATQQGAQQFPTE